LKGRGTELANITAAADVQRFALSVKKIAADRNKFTPSWLTSSGPARTTSLAAALFVPVAWR